MATVESLSESDVAIIREESSAGRQSTLWFTSSAVGVPTGGSAKVASVGEVAEGEFIEVRPAGSRDTMFCSPNELTRTRPPRKRAPQPVGAQPVSAPVPTVPAMPVSTEPVSTEPVTGQTARLTGKDATEAGTIVVSGRDTSGVEDPASSAGRRAGQRRPPSAEVTVTLFGSVEGEWTVEVMVGKKRVVRLMPLQPAEVAKASRSLPAPVAEAIEASLTVARDRQAERIERLRAELETAQRVLRDLSS